MLKIMGLAIEVEKVSVQIDLSKNYWDIPLVTSFFRMNLFPDPGMSVDNLIKTIATVYKQLWNSDILNLEYAVCMKIAIMVARALQISENMICCN